MRKIRFPLALVTLLITLAACGQPWQATELRVLNASRHRAVVGSARSSSPVQFPATGAPAPDFRLTSSSGAAFHLAEALEAGRPLVLVFYPGPYCRWCLGVLRKLEEHRAGLEANGFRLIAVTTSSLSEAAANTPVLGVQFEILADSDAAVTRLYGAPPLLPGRHKHMPAPIKVFVIDPAGQITWSGPAVIDGALTLTQWLNCARPGCEVPAP